MTTTPLEAPPKITDLETRGVEPIPDEERTARPLDLFRLVFGGANTIATVVLGSFPIIFGLSFRDALLSTLLGLVLGATILAPMALFGPRNGTNNAVSSSAHLGVHGRVIGSFLSLLTAIAFFSISVWSSGDVLVGGANRAIGLPQNDFTVAIAYGVVMMIGWFVRRGWYDSGASGVAGTGSPTAGTGADSAPGWCRRARASASSTCPGSSSARWVTSQEASTSASPSASGSPPCCIPFCSGPSRNPPTRSDRTGRAGYRPGLPPTTPSSPSNQFPCKEFHLMSTPIGPIDASKTPRFAGPASFARLPRLDQVPRADVVVAGVPFDSGVSYRPGARFGPTYVREASRLLRPYNPALDVSPFEIAQVADAGDIAVNPFNIGEAIETIEAAALELTADGTRLVTIGADHTIALPLLRAAANRHGPVALVHFDAHLDTWDTYFGAEYTHGTPFRRAVEEGILDTEALSHVGTRGPLYGKKDLEDDRRFGFGIVTSSDVYYQGVVEVVDKLRQRLGNRPVYVSIDIDVLDPAHAPGTGTPEAGGITSRELLEILRGFRGLNIIGADVVEVAPAYDHAEITGVAASHVAYDLVSLLALKHEESARG